MDPAKLAARRDRANKARRLGGRQTDWHEPCAFGSVRAYAGRGPLANARGWQAELRFGEGGDGQGEEEAEDEGEELTDEG